MKKNRDNERGMALITVLMLSALLSSLLMAYYLVTNFEAQQTRNTMSSSRGFYAAEAGLNLRAEGIRQTFVGFNRPAGTSPPTTAGQLPCQGSNGAGDFGCQSYTFRDRTALTYINEPPGNPTIFKIPPGEPFQNLISQEYSYIVTSISTDRDSRPEAVLGLDFKSRVIPMFQFAAFYNKDLEILPGPPMRLSGPVHTNGDLYLSAGNTLDILGQVTTAEDLYHGRKDKNDCTGTVSVIDPVTLLPLPPCTGGRVQVPQSALGAWHNMINTQTPVVTVPEPDDLASIPGSKYFEKADLRVQMVLTGGTPQFEIRNPDDSLDSARTTAMKNNCPNAVVHTDTMYNFREGDDIEMLDVDLEKLLDCAYTQNLLMHNRPLDDNTEGGLVFHFGVEGIDENNFNNYGVRIREGEELKATSALAPPVKGLTIVTDQAVYVQGNYNSSNKKPAAFLADSLNVLSESWDDLNANKPKSDRVASDTTINAAFLAGTDSTGGTEGSGGQDAGIYNGGLENYPRLHETWSGKTLTYRGSFVSLNLPTHVDGEWGSSSYSPPNRDWDYDTDFNDAAKLPPLSPVFVYLRQQLFVRDFEL